jgi:hypothetical protein
MAAGDSGSGSHLVAFGAKDANARSAANVDAAASNGTTVTVNNIGADRDEELDIAVEVVRELPVESL